MSRLRFAPMLVVAALVMLGCQGKPLPPELASYAGQWQGGGMELAISPGGQVNYHRVEGGATTSVNGPIQEYTGADFSVGVACISTTFVVSSPPHQEPDGTWRMTVDGVELIKVGG
jgi:hypothetical protein